MKKIVIAASIAVLSPSAVTAAGMQDVKYYARQSLVGLSRANQTTPTQPSASFRWDEKGFGAWSSSCDAAATRTQVVNCVDDQNNVAEDARCSSAGPKPATTEGPKLITSQCAAEFKNGGFESQNASWSGNTSTTYTKAAARSGSFGVNLSPQGDPGFARQTFKTVPGVNYTLSYYGYRTAGSANTQLEDGTRVVQNAALAGALNTYVQYSISWKATSANATITFFLGTRGGFDIMRVDDIVLTAS